MKQMNICYLANAASIHTQRWVNYFAENGWKVDLITWHSPGKTAKFYPDITIHRIHFPPHYLARYGALLEITWLLRKIRPDIVHAHYLSHFGIIAGLYQHLSGFRPIVMTAWGSDVLIDAKRCKKILMSYSLKKADCITCEGKYTSDVLVKLGARMQQIKFIHFAVDTAKFNPEKRNEELRSDLEIFDSPLIISIRSLKPIYDVESLIKAVPLVLKEIPEAKFLILGEGSQRAYLEDLASSLGISNNIRFVGSVLHDLLPPYLASADIYVSTALSDSGLAVSTAEAMACGLPVVITDFGDNNEWVQDGSNGYLVPLSDPQSLSLRIVQLLRDKELRIRLGKAGRKSIEERNSWGREMIKMGKIYEDLIERNKK